MAVRGTFPSASAVSSTIEEGWKFPFLSNGVHIFSVYWNQEPCKIMWRCRFLALSYQFINQIQAVFFLPVFSLIFTPSLFRKIEASRGFYPQYIGVGQFPFFFTTKQCTLSICSVGWVNWPCINFTNCNFNLFFHTYMVLSTITKIVIPKFSFVQ